MFKKEKQNKIPSYFICPITLELIKDPTISPCGHMFDREAIVGWLQDKSHQEACPLCNKRIELKSLAPCYPLKAAIAEYQSKSGDNLIATVGKKMANLKMFGKSEKEPEGNVPPPAQTVSQKRQTNSNAIPKDFCAPKPASASLDRRNDKTTKERPKQPWAILSPLVHTFSPLDVIRDEFTFGRSPQCDQVYNFSELSGFHCTVYRVLRENSNSEYDYFLEDKSTNGTYVNGNRVGKGLIANLVDGDEIAFGERLFSKIIPQLPAFVGLDMSAELTADIDHAKAIGSFLEFIKMDDAQLLSAGIRTESSRKKIITATTGWLEKYRFPAFRLNIQQQSRTAAAPSSVAVQSSATDVPSEIYFEPSLYSERINAGVVVFYLRRSKSCRGVVQVLIRSTEKSGPRQSQLYQPFEKKVVFGEGVDEANVEFFWRSDCPLTANHTVVFELRITGGNGHVSQPNEAVLTIEAGRFSSHPINIGPLIERSRPDTAPAQKASKVPPRLAEHNMYTESDPGGDNRSPIRESFDNNGYGDEPVLTQEQQRVADELLALMMDSFPSVEASAIAKVIRDERNMLAPVDDRHLLQDLVAIKLTNLVSGDPNAMEVSNLRFSKSSQDEESLPLEDDSGLIPLQQVKSPIPLIAPNAKSPPQVQTSNPNSSDAFKQKQSILRYELESFLQMASLALVRKFFSMQGIGCNFSHINSPVVQTSVELTASFLKTLEGLKPVEIGSKSSRASCSKYVYNNGNGLRSKASSVDPNNFLRGFRYDIAMHKSSHHLKMENNHAIIEDLNSFAKLAPNAPQSSFYGVFDGHGGYLISEYLSLQLASNIARHPLFIKNPLEAIKQSYLKTDEDVLRKITRDRLKGGSTAVTAIIRDNAIYIAWAGDARCVIFRQVGPNLVPFPIVNPHNPQGPEKNRIVKAGGSVDYIAGKWRVNGRLAVTRAFGDENLKSVVIAEPEMTRFPLLGDEKFLMLSCDGLYDVMEYTDVSESLDKMCKRGMKLNQISTALVEEGVTRGSTDDITVMLVDLSSRLG